MELSLLLYGWPASALLIVCGCGGSSPATAPKTDTNAAAVVHAKLPIQIRTDIMSNGGAALHVLVREVRSADFPRLEYDDVAAALQAKEDPKTLDWIVVLPNERCQMEIERPSGGDVAVYFLFAAPSEDWRTLIPMDQKGPVWLTATEHSICTNNVAPKCKGSVHASNDSEPAPKPCRSFGH